MSARIARDDPTQWKVEGDLTFASVPEIQGHSPDWFGAPPESLDLGGVEQIDSAGIALVIEWSRRAQAAGAALRLIDVPTGMSSLLKTTGLDRLLTIDDAH